MWEAIRDNVRRSRLLIALMGSVLALLGWLIGMVYGGTPGAGLAGVVGALAVWAVLLVTALSGGGGQVLLRGAGARRIDKQDQPRLWNVVEEMTIAAGLDKMPAVYVIDDDMPNAFAVGRRPELASVAVTSGLLRRLSRDELQGVVAHEIGHIRNLDVRFLTLAAVMVGSVAIVSDVFLRSLWYGGGRKRHVRRAGQAQLVIGAAALAVALLAPICVQLLYYACSRRREYLADASAARFTRYPPGLAAALEKIAGVVVPGRGVMRVLAPMYIVNPLRVGGGGGLFDTHPPTHRRIEILRAMGGLAGFKDYEAAYERVLGAGARCLGARTLAAEASVPARHPATEPQPRAEAVARAREAVDLLDRVVNFVLVGCPCGVRIKVPPELRLESIGCPRCGRAHAIPKAEPSLADPATEAPMLRYRRRGEGWESFRCACGHGLQLSPGFLAETIQCARCKRRIDVVHG
jgi:heat shock protein HtpX